MRISTHCQQGPDNNADGSSRLKVTFPDLSLRLAVIVLAAVGSGCFQSMGVEDLPAQTRSEHPPYTLGPGDRVRITVYQHEDLSGTFVVDDTGSISLPLVQRIEVSGLTLRDLEGNVTADLVKQHIVDPRVSVDLTELRPFCVLGEVRNPGCFSYTYEMTAGKAIAEAGGYSYRARENELVITDEAGKKMWGDHDTPVFRGDTIEVLERFF